MSSPPLLLACVFLALAAPIAATADKPLPHIVMHLVDDWGWANAGWHTDASSPAGEVRTPRMDALVKAGIELDRAYSYQFCSPTRCSLQSGRLPMHVNDKNLAPEVYNPADPDSGFAGIPRNMTGMATKLKQAGYRTHQIGKWDAGMATWDHTPVGRGYDTSFGYFHHDNDYFNETLPRNGRLVDLWDTRQPAYSMNSSCSQAGRGACKQVSGCSNYGIGPEAIYEEKMFVDRAVQIIDEHPGDPAHPLFLNYDSHIVHSPLQAPDFIFHELDFMKDDWDGHRQLYAAMVAYLDHGVGRIVDALEARGMWNNTLWFCQSDNGGPSFTGDNHTANNFPLRGAKYSNWEGGVRVNAFVSGGALAKLAPARVGSKLDGFVHIADYYATFAALAGVSPYDEKAAAAGLPPVDSLNLWPYLSGAVTESPRTEVWNDLGVLIMGRYKLYNASGPYGALAPDGSGDAVQQYGCFPGRVFPNASVNDGPAWVAKGITGVTKCSTSQRCPNGVCLYDIFADPTEHNNLSGEPAMQQQIRTMLKRLAQLEATYFSPKRGKKDPLAEEVAWTKWKGFYGPFIFDD